LNTEPDQPIFSVPVKDFTRISEERQPQGIALVARIRAYDVQSKPPREDHLVYLDRISDPGNLGTIIRSAAWFGIQTLLLSPHSADPFQPKVVRSSVGGIGQVNIYQNVDVSQLKKLTGKLKYTAIASIIGNGQAAEKLRNLSDKKVMLLLGSEAHGLTSELIDLCQIKVSIPQPGFGESLNLSAAAAILFYLLCTN
ncbi:MAG TPA: RNA methyltransferase, partial [Calditrichaeota bacterium]|nr:RNA methyltransferase [Calditrichota bacterium]